MAATDTLNLTPTVTLEDVGEDLANQSTLTAWSQQTVEAGVAAEVTAVVVLVVGVVGNVVVMGVFLGRPCGRTPMQVDRVVGLLALMGLLTTLASVPFHIASFLTGEYPARGSLCQVQGFLLNLLCLLSLWYTAVLAVERYVKFASPHEHTLTFSLLNLNVVLCGVLVLLLIEVSGPIYGWAEYGYVSDCGVCVLDPVSTHILTYTVIQTACYVSLPVLITVCAALCILHRCCTDPGPLTQGSQVLKSGAGMSVLCGAMLLCALLMLPYHVLLMLQASQRQIPVWSKVVAYWLKITALTCVYPGLLLSAAPSEVWPAVVALRRCWAWRCLRQDDPGLHLSSLDLGAGADDSLRKGRRISRSSHATDTTFLSSPAHSARDAATPPPSLTRV
nr:pinopsin-like isoform X1 [Procambarus clarkii]XP_045584876.1 pinopsin-like isoform X1 [Procambarus clarkii]XP_045584877.1 pinopsin-like isoform X1 [Procambarus clarkii]XP_045584878.1 pinopsin-like isoform X1 [Procambarus clarkii]